MIGNGSASIRAASGIPVVIMENRPLMKDGDILSLCMERFGPGPTNFELVSVACLKHFLKNDAARAALAAYLRRLGSAGRHDGALVITSGGSHRTAVRLLRAAEAGMPVQGITVADRAPRRAETALIAWSHNSLHGNDMLRTAVMKEFGVRGPMHMLTVPAPAHALGSSAVWLDVLQSGLRYLGNFGLRRAILLGDLLRYDQGFDRVIPVADLVAVQQRMKDAHPDIAIDIAGFTDENASEGPRVRRLIADA